MPAEQRTYPPGVREKDRGIWQTWTWREYERQVRDLALGLAALGFRRGDRLSVIGDNRPRLYWAQVAAQCLGGVPVPVYQDSIAKELAFVWNHAEVSVIVAAVRSIAMKSRSVCTQRQSATPARAKRTRLKMPYDVIPLVSLSGANVLAESCEESGT